MRIPKKQLIITFLIELVILNACLTVIAWFHPYVQFQWHQFLVYSLFLNLFWIILASERFYEGKEFMYNRQYPLYTTGKQVFKRLFDIFFSAVMIAFVFTWLFPIVALIIKLTSKGPVLFIQERTGIHNRTFKCYKFRSMIVNNLSDVLQALPNDRRITPFGRIIRQTHIDELPQFINVLMGQMSVVGPRPHMLLHTKQYSVLIDNYVMRHYVKPGITGWAQLNGFCGDTVELWKMAKRVEFDLFYIKNWTFFWDIQIIWQTVFKDKSLKMLSEVKSDNPLSMAAS